MKHFIKEINPQQETPEERTLRSVLSLHLCPHGLVATGNGQAMLSGFSVSLGYYSLNLLQVLYLMFNYVFFMFLFVYMF